MHHTLGYFHRTICLLRLPSGRLAARIIRRLFFVQALLARPLRRFRRFPPNLLTANVKAVGAGHKPNQGLCVHPLSYYINALGSHSLTMTNSTDISQATFVWQEILEPVRGDLEQVEARFHEKLVSSVPEVTQIGQYLQVSGGKRLRPALLLMTARMFGKIQPSAVNLGAVVEMIHTATLVHDDVIDGADRRRGRPSTNSRWGNHTSVLAGDWLYMQAFRLAVEERNFRVLDILIELTQQMVEGELIQWGMIGRLDISREAQLDLIFRKTACLFSACTRLGAVVCGQSPLVEEQLARYGTNLGMAFQLVDDLLDFTATEELLGKPVGSDLREGKVTLPLIHVLERCTPAEHALVSKVMEERAFQSVAWEDLLALLWRYEAPQAVKALAQDYAAQAVNAIESLASAGLDKRARQTLAMLPELFVHRQY